MRKTLAALATAASLGCSPVLTYNAASLEAPVRYNSEIDCSSNIYQGTELLVNGSRIAYDQFRIQVPRQEPKLYVSVPGRFSDISIDLWGNGHSYTQSASKEVNGEGGFTSAICELSLPQREGVDTANITIQNLDSIKEQVILRIEYK